MPCRSWASISATFPLAQWRTYLKYHFLANAADVLPKAFDDEAFDFYGRTLNGQQQQRERWKRAVDALDGALGEAVGQLYVAKYFPPDSKAKMLDLVENLRKAYAQRVQQLAVDDGRRPRRSRSRSSPTFRPKIGYPDKWRDYSTLEVHAGRCLRQRDARARCSTGTATPTGSASRRIATSGA